MNEIDAVTQFLDDQEDVGIKFYSDAGCETEVGKDAILSYIRTQKLGTVDATTTYYAVRGATTYNVAIAEYNSAHGTVTVSYNDGTNHEFTSGNTNIDGGTTLTITAVPETGYKLTGLTITPSGESAANHTSGSTYTPTKNITVTATFVAKAFTLTINSTSHGTITCSNGMYVQGAAAQSIAVGTTVTFTATPAEHYELTGWTGAVSGTGLQKSLTVGANMDEALTVGATFALEQFTVTASPNNDLYGSVTGGGTFDYNTSVTVTATANDGYRFVDWSDGTTTATHPAFTLSENVTLTANFALESENKTVDVYQNTTANTTKILYALTPKTVGGITYTPIDLGYGVAWADRNMGAATTSATGNYYAWGNLSSGTSFSHTTYYNGSAGTAQAMSAGTNLPNDHDAAYNSIGHYWHIPTYAQWSDLLTNCTVDNYTYTGATGNSISLPATGYYNTNGGSVNSISNSSKRYYWTATKGFYSSTLGNNSGVIYEDGELLGNGAWCYDGRLGNGLVIRPVYMPTYTIYTLTINVGSYKYVYKCQSGQSITVDVHATELGATFNKWSEDNNTNATRTFTVTSNMTYTATFTEATTYSITFVDDDGETVLDGPKDVVEGVVPTYGGSAPTKAATAQYTYSFNGWSPALYAADKNQTYTATYSGTLNQYTITWKSEDGSETLETDADQNYGTTTAFNGATPTKAATAQYTYTFDGWATSAGGEKVYNNGETPAVGGAATYYAHFSATTNNYTVSIVSSNAEYGTVDVASVASVPYGTTITTSTNTIDVNGTTVTATPATVTGYTCTFDNWTNGTATVTGALTVTANFSRAAITYDLTYEGLNGASNSNPATYTIETATFELANPGARSGYTFTGWTCGGSPITQITVGSTGDKTITANWTLDVTNYDLTFQAGANGTVSGTAAGAAKAAGTTHSIADGTAISLSATPDNTFHAFAAWLNTSDDATVSTDNPYNFTLTANTDLTASFAIANPMPLGDNEAPAYYTDYDALAGNTGVNVRLNRTFNADRWSTVMLPFGIDFEEAGNEMYDGLFYEFHGATGDYNGLTLNFTPAGHAEANTPYLFRSASTVANPVFHNVTLAARASGYAGQAAIGDVKFIGTTEPVTLHNEGDDSHTLLFLNNNRLYYPNLTTGNKLRAFRAYFLVGGLAGMQPRVRIVVEDQNATVIETAETDDAVCIRKYVKDGILVIERNGIRYDVTGKEIR